MVFQGRLEKKAVRVTLRGIAAIVGKASHACMSFNYFLFQSSIVVLPLPVFFQNLFSELEADALWGFKFFKGFKGFLKRF